MHVFPRNLRDLDFEIAIVYRIQKQIKEQRIKQKKRILNLSLVAAARKLARRCEVTIGRAAGSVKRTDVSAVAAQTTSCTDVIKRSAPRWEVTIGPRLGAARI